MKFIYIIDYIFPTIRSGDSKAAIAEAGALKSNGHDVLVISNYDEKSNSIHGQKFVVDGIGQVNNEWIDNCNEADAVIVHQVSSIEYAMELKRKYGFIVIGRMHVQYDKLLGVSRALKCGEEDIVNRMSPSITKDKYDLFLSCCDSLIGAEVDAPSLTTRVRYWYFPPVIGLMDKKYNRKKRNPRYRTVDKIKSIVVGGRLTDPAKGFNRVVELARLCEKNQTRLSIVGNISNDQKLMLSEFSYVIVYEWIDSKNEYIKILLRSDVFVVTSYYESFGLMTMEAMLQGLLVISCGQGFLGNLKGLMPDIYFVDDTLLPDDFARNVFHAIRMIENNIKFNVNRFNSCTEFVLEEIMTSYNVSTYIDLLEKIILNKKSYGEHSHFLTK